MRTAASGGAQARNVPLPQNKTLSPLKLAGLPPSATTSGGKAQSGAPPRPHSSRAHHGPSSAGARSGSGGAPDAVALPPTNPQHKNMHPPLAPKSPSQCTETCYWRWLVHMLLEDVALLKANVDQAQDEFLEQVKERKRLEHTVTSYANLQVAHKTLKEELGILKDEAPVLLEDRERLQEELEELEFDIAELEQTKETLTDTADRVHKKRIRSEKQLEMAQKETEDLRTSSTAAKTNLEAMQNDRARLEIELRDTKKETEELRVKVAEIEGGKKKKKGKSKSPKPK
eukprot:gnl/MRDRNA2_/MRDRNA2_28803_c0_seq1.p1 gnl/MRDRNA2_/MRDRNA2_28803_c0~~gnl/MRDRNA2_/MRDRNA2_28803_c0_seq1.p1  ORF type:complete len:286 (+),score=77.42 gnl/MRDRNA2_/MRDRNA2_28803_c0_seq1:52-909(+)